MTDVAKQQKFNIKGTTDLHLYGATDKSIEITGAECVNIFIKDYCHLKHKDAIVFRDCKTVILNGNEKLLVEGTIKFIGDTEYVLIDEIVSIGATNGVQMEDGYVEYGTVCIVDCKIINPTLEGMILGDPYSTRSQFDYLEISGCAIKGAGREGVYIRGVHYGVIRDSDIKSNSIYDTVISDNVTMAHNDTKFGTMSIHKNSVMKDE